MHWILVFKTYYVNEVFHFRIFCFAFKKKKSHFSFSPRVGCDPTLDTAGGSSAPAHWDQRPRRRDALLETAVKTHTARWSFRAPSRFCVDCERRRTRYDLSRLVTSRRLSVVRSRDRRSEVLCSLQLARHQGLASCCTRVVCFCQVASFICHRWASP